MFKCEKCRIYQDEIKHLREETAKLLDRIILLTDLNAYGAVHQPKPDPSYFGGGNDDEITFDEYGQKIIKGN